MQPDVLSELNDLLIQLDNVAEEALQTGDTERGVYYYGVSAGIEIARRDLSQLVVKLMQAQTCASGVVNP
jgi:hypothetical protein